MGTGDNKPFDWGREYEYGIVIGAQLVAESRYVTEQDFAKPMVTGPVIQISIDQFLFNQWMCCPGYKTLNSNNVYVDKEWVASFKERNPDSMKRIQKWMIEYFDHLQEYKSVLDIPIYPFNSPMAEAAGLGTKPIDNRRTMKNYKIDKRYEATYPPNKKWRCRFCWNAPAEPQTIDCACAESTERQAKIDAATLKKVSRKH